MFSWRVQTDHVQIIQGHDHHSSLSIWHVWSVSLVDGEERRERIRSITYQACFQIQTSQPSFEQRQLLTLTVRRARSNEGLQGEWKVTRRTTTAATTRPTAKSPHAERVYSYENPPSFRPTLHNAMLLKCSQTKSSSSLL